MAKYTYRFADLLTDRDICELELTGVSFDRRIIQPGTFQGNVAVTDSLTASAVRNIVPEKTICHVYRGEELWGSYIIWQKTIDTAERGSVTVGFQGSTLESWLYRRIVPADVTYTHVDQIDIAKLLIASAQVGNAPFASSADLGIVTLAGNSGVIRDRTYLLSDAASVGQRLEELADVDNGFEYMIDVYVDPNSGERVRLWRWGYPELGQTEVAWSFEQPGNITHLKITEDGTDSGTAFWARGDSIGDDATEAQQALMTPTPVLATEFLAQGFPHIDVVADYSSVTDLTTLTAYATWWAQNKGGVVKIPEIEVRPTNEDFQIISPSRLGDYANISIVNIYYPLNSDGTPSYSGHYRIVGIEVNPNERGTQETMKLVIAQAFDPTGSS
jgi:hypothetical protein